MHTRQTRWETKRQGWYAGSNNYDVSEVLLPIGWSPTNLQMRDPAAHTYMYLHIFSTTWRFPSGDFVSWCRLEISSGLLKLRHDPRRAKRKPADNDVVDHWFAWYPELLPSPYQAEPKIKLIEIYSNRHILNLRGSMNTYCVLYNQQQMLSTFEFPSDRKWVTVPCALTRTTRPGLPHISPYADGQYLL